MRNGKTFVLKGGNAGRIACMASNNNNPLLGAYLVVGEDHLKREAVMRRLKVRLEKEGDLSFNYDTFDGTASGDAIVSAARTLPFASEKRLVVVEDADKLNKKSQTQISSYLEDPAGSTVLILVADKLAKNTVMYKRVAALGKSAVIECIPPKKSELANQIRAMATTHGVTITPGAAKLLLELVGEDTVHLDAELQKLSLSHFTNSPIDEAEVQELVARISEPKPWEYVDAFSARDLASCMRMRLLMRDASPYALLRQCVARIRELICAQALIASNRASVSALAKELKTQDWRVKNHFRWAKGFSARELRHALEASLEAERKMKSGGDPDATFTEWVIQTIKS